MPEALTRTDLTDGTIAFYDREAESYAEGTLSNDLSAFHEELVDKLPTGGRILDAGSGSGRDILAFQRRGFAVEAFDASSSLAKLASRVTGNDVQVSRFEDWPGAPDRYDGIWCFASLLHVRRKDLPAVLDKLIISLKPGGWLFASFKHGTQDAVDRVGRRFTNLTVGEAKKFFGAANGLQLSRVWEEPGPAALGGSTTWVYILAQRSR